MPDHLAAIKSLPRDTTTVIAHNPNLADAMTLRGYRAVSIYAKAQHADSVKDEHELEDCWSLLSCRTGNAATIGSRALGENVRRLAEQSRVNTQTAIFRARGWVENLLANFHHLTQPLAMDIVKPRGVPVFIVGAGPSLDRNHRLIEQCKRKGLVISINAACRAHPPHIALTVESNDIRFKLGELGPKVVRAFGMTSHPDVMSHGEGPLLPVYSGEMSQLLEKLTRRQRLHTCGNGGTAAVSLAERLDASHVILLGHDFALEDGGRLYPECLGIGDSFAHIRPATKDEPEHWEYDWAPILRKQPRVNPMHEADAVIDTPGAWQETVTATGSLISPRMWMQQAAKRLTRRKLINASEAGANIEGWRNAKLGDVLAELPDQHIRIEAEGGIPAEHLKDWIWGHLESLRQVSTAALAMSIARNDDLGEHLSRVVPTVMACPLIEPWCHAEIAEALTTRRSTPVDHNLWREYLRGCDDMRAIADVTAIGSHSLETGMVDAMGRVKGA